MCGWHLLQLGAGPHAQEVRAQQLLRGGALTRHLSSHRSSGRFESMFVLPSESSFEYKFVVDGKWTHKEDMVRAPPPSPQLSGVSVSYFCSSLPPQPKTHDPFGGHNNVLDTHSPPP